MVNQVNLNLDLRYNKFKYMKKKELPTKFSKDTPVVLLLTVNVILMLISSTSVIFRLRPNDFKIPIQYIVYDGTIVQSGNWFSLYGFLLFILAGGVMTIFLAHRIYKANRLFSIAVLSVYLVLSVYSLLTINALLSLVERV